MKRNQMTLLWGILLVVVGLLVLLQNLGYLGAVMPLVWALVFGLAGLTFLYVCATDRERWWAVIPGMALLGIALLVGLDEIAPRLGGKIGGSLFLLMLSLAFWIVYLVRRPFWWAIIPGGVLLTLAGVAGLDELAPGANTEGLFFLGMGATFALVGLLPGGRGRRWSFIPAGVLLVMGVIFAASSSGFLGYLVPITLVVGGAFFVFKGFLAQPKE